MDITESKLKDGTPWWLIQPPNAKESWVVLWIYGFTSSAGKHQERCVRMADRSKIAHAMVDYTGHGLHPKSIDKATRKEQYEEVCAVYNELVKLGYSKIIVSGGSFGGYLTALLSGVKQPEAIVLRAPANYPDSEWETPFQKTGAAIDRDSKFRQDYTEDFTNSATESVRKYRGKTWVMEHELDDVVPGAIPRSFYKAAQNPCEYIVIKGLGHSFRHQDNVVELIKVLEDHTANITAEVVKGSLD